MNNKTLLTAIYSLLLAAVLPSAAQVAHFPMSLTDGKIAEQVSGKTFVVNTQQPACTVSGIDGDALLFDGWSNYIQAALPSGISNDEITLSVLLAPQTYPMMVLDVAENTPSYGTICGNLSDDGKSGFALKLSSQGDIQAAFGSAYGGGYARTITGNKKLPRSKWSRITFVYSKSKNAATLYLNGESIATAKAQNYALNASTQPFMIGKDSKVMTAYNISALNINTYVGLIDDIAIWNNAMTDAEVAAMNPPAGITPDFNYPAERYATGLAALWRPMFHGMPSAGWTNESHGLVYANGKYHVFFQKNANGPYMSRLHWGHISSENLYKWREENIAFGPDQSYDIKGCWSGCVTTPDMPGNNDGIGILYTSVDNAKATIAQVTPLDADLIAWQKADNNPIINGRPQGLSDDFRDPYYFTANGEKYIIVGTSKNGLGACTLHKYVNGKWTNNGDIFFQATSAAQHGTFWEMPNITRMGENKWLFTCTPLGTSLGVRTICWVGTIGTDGKFKPTGEMQYLEMGGMSKDGYGLLSPSLLTNPKDAGVADGSCILLGIVPDKLGANEMIKVGWSHNYSLPRVITLDANDNIIQKPYDGLAAMRTEQTCKVSLAGNETASLAPVKGRQVEINADFIANSGTGVINVLKDGDKKVSLIYDADRNTITLNTKSLPCIVNDNPAYRGLYTATLPERPAAGSKVNVHLYVDGSIVDVFVADKWAFSVRIFPTSETNVDAEILTTGAVTAEAQAWILDADRNDPSGITAPLLTHEPTSNLYNICGQQLSSAPAHGVYIKSGKKCLAN